MLIQRPAGRLANERSKSPSYDCHLVPGSPAAGETVAQTLCCVVPKTRCRSYEHMEAFARSLCVGQISHVRLMP